MEQDSPLYNVKSQAPLFYAESWALVHMLYLGDDYRPKLRGLLEGIKAGASMADNVPKGIREVRGAGGNGPPVVYGRETV